MSSNNIIIQLQTTKETCNESDILSMVVSNVEFIAVNGLLRVLGAGNMEYFNSEIKLLYPGNKLIIAHDIFGGIFCINNKDFEDNGENIWYFSPDALEWENLCINYSEFIHWLCHEEFIAFYESFLWKDINQMLVEMDIMKGILIYPFLWANECDIESASKRIIPFLELVELNEEYRKQFTEKEL